MTVLIGVKSAVALWANLTIPGCSIRSARTLGIAQGAGGMYCGSRGAEGPVPLPACAPPRCGGSKWKRTSLGCPFPPKASLAAFIEPNFRVISKANILKMCTPPSMVAT